jgi:hypothetical protein
MNLFRESVPVDEKEGEKDTPIIRKEVPVEIGGNPPFRQKGNKQVLRLRYAPLRMTERMGTALSG